MTEAMSLLVLAMLFVWGLGFLYTAGLVIGKSVAQSGQATIAVVCLAFILWPVILGFEYD